MITAQVQTKAGLIKIRIDDGGDATEAIITGLGSLSYDFDQTPEQVSIDRTQALYSSLNVSVYRDDIFGRNLWERIVQGEFESVPAFIDIDANDGGDYAFVFRLSRSDVSFNERSETIDLRLLPNVNKDLTAGDVFDILSETQGVQQAFYRFRTIDTSGSVDPSDNPKQVNCYSVKDFISATLSNVFQNPLPTYINSAKSNLPGHTERLYDDLPTDNFRGFVMADAPKAIPGQFGLETAFLQSEEVVKSALGVGRIDVFDNVPIDPTYLYRVVGFGTDFNTQIAIGDSISFIGRPPGDFLNVFEIDNDTQTLLCNGVITPEGLTVPGGKLIENSLYYIEKRLYPRDIPALDVMRSLASAEGSIFGTGFSQNFYFNRLVDDTPVVTLNWEEVIDFKPSMFSLSLGNSIVAQRADYLRSNANELGSWSMTGTVARSNFPNLADTTAITQGNPGATKELRIETAPGYPFLNKAVKRFGLNQYDGSVYTFLGNQLIVEGRDNRLELSLATVGLQSYFQALNNANGGIMVEFKIMGAMRIKPWNSVQFDSRAPERYRDKQFRITSVAYDLVEDIATIKAYQISDIATPVIPDELVETPIDFRFGSGLLPDRLLKAVGSDISRRFIDTTDFLFRTTAPLSGTVTRIFFERNSDAIGLRLLKGWNVLVVDPIANQRQYFEVAKTSSPQDDFFDVEPIELSRTFAGGSYIYVSQAQVLAGLINGVNLTTIFAQSQSIGTLTASVDGDEIEELEVLLNTRIRAGQDLEIVSDEGTLYGFTVAENYDAGVRTINIKDTNGNGSRIKATAGSILIGNPVSTQAEFNVSPGEIAFGVDAEHEKSQIAQIATEVPAGGVITELPLSYLRADLFAGQKILVSAWTDTLEFTVDGDYSATGSPITIDVVGQFLNFDLAPFDNVFEPSYSQSGRITVNANQIVLKVDSNGKIALISLIGDPDTGTEINIEADQINIDGQTTFINSLKDEGFITDADLPDSNVIIRADGTGTGSDVGPTERPDTSTLVVGDMWINTAAGKGNLPHTWSGSAWIRAYTVINGGDITTGTIDAQRIDVNGVITAGSIIVSGDNVSQLTNDEGFTDFDAGDVETAIANNVTTIDGGKINTGIIQSNNYAYTSGNFSTTGSNFDLTNGNIISKEFSIVSGAARFKGDLDAASGTFTGALSGGSVIVGDSNDGVTIDGNGIVGTADSTEIFNLDLVAQKLTMRGEIEIIGGTIEAIVPVDTAGAFQSDNYDEGVAGWSIDGDGNAEFNDIVARGRIEANAGTLGGLTVDGVLAFSATGSIISSKTHPSGGDLITVINNNGYSLSEEISASNVKQTSIEIGGITVTETVSSITSTVQISPTGVTSPSVQSAYKSSDGSTGITQTITFNDGVTLEVNTVTIKNGIITGWTQII